MNTTDLKPLPDRPDIEQYRREAGDLLKSGYSGRIVRNHPHAPASATLADAQLVIAREHGFESWPNFEEAIRELSREDSPFSKFERAADAIVAGEEARLKSLLDENPELIHVRSGRVHHAGLIHYISANGFENYRQKTPPNAVAIAKILLDAGADPNAIADCYGKSSVLLLVASSVHPKRAGVQIELMQLLLDRGAKIDGVNAALHNGRGEAAAFLARRGAELDLEGAAGVGRLDLVEKFFSEGSVEQKNAAFSWACEYGHNDVVNFLLSNGVIGEERMPGLHWAIIGGQLETIRFLLDRGVSLETRNMYGGTALGQALWSAQNGDPTIEYAPIGELLVERGAEVYPGWMDALRKLRAHRPPGAA
ncbi:MAG TPA: ankyrin repeat domain-containing protein [Bryobacteraceae bacterium]